MPVATAGGYNNQAFLAQYAKTIQQVLQADDKLFGYMTFVSRLLDRFYKYEGRLPSSAQEQKRFKDTAAKVLKENPYQPQIVDLWEHKAIPLDNPVPIVFLPNSGLTPTVISEAMKAPPESWRGEPGTIYVMTDCANVYMIYGISADRMPLRRFDTQGLPMRAITRDCYNDARTSIAGVNRAAK